MKKILVVVDMQKDFTYGALRNEDAIAIIPAVKEKIESFKGDVIFTLDTHTSDYLSTQEGKKLPVIHCVENTDGWELVDELKPLANGKTVIKKPTFGSLELAEMLAKLNETEPIDEITLVGICTDICVISNAMLIKAAMPEVTVKVDAKCCAGVTQNSHDTALLAMASCQIEII